MIAGGRSAAQTSGVPRNGTHSAGRARRFDTLWHPLRGALRSMRVPGISSLSLVNFRLPSVTPPAFGQFPGVIAKAIFSSVAQLFVMGVRFLAILPGVVSLIYPLHLLAAVAKPAKSARCAVIGSRSGKAIRST